MSSNQCILFKFTQVQNPAELRFYKALYFYAQLRYTNQILLDLLGAKFWAYVHIQPASKNN